MEPSLGKKTALDIEPFGLALGSPVVPTLGATAAASVVYYSYQLFDHVYHQVDEPNADQSIENGKSKERNTNPFNGIVSSDLMIADENSNIIPIKAGERLTGSYDGKWLQVRDEYGSPTGLRKDGPHSSQTHNDSRALEPHAHVPGVENKDGTPWLPINY